MRERTMYLGVITFLLSMLFIFAVRSHINYRELAEANDQFISVIDEQRSSYNSQYELWKQNYEELQTEYGTLLTENDKLLDALNGMSVPIYDYTEAEVYLLAQCVEAEAGNYENHYLSQQYITQVILNRLHSSEFPNSIEEVIYQKVNGVRQFCVAYNGSMEDREVEPETLANVYSVLIHGTDLPEYVCYFYSDYVTENWVNTLNTYDTVQGTVFAYDSKGGY